MQDNHQSLLSQAVVFAKGGFTHQSQEVRGQSFHVILECYKTLGRDAIKVHLSGLRLAQQDILEKGFSKVDEERVPQRPPSIQ